MSFGDRFCSSRKGGIGGSGWVHPKGANSMAASGPVSWLALGGPLLAKMELETSDLTL